MNQPASADCYQFIGAVRDVHEQVDGAEFRTEETRVRVRAVREGVFEVRLALDGAPFDAPFSYARVPDYFDAEPPEVTVSAEDDAVRIGTGAGWAVVGRSPLRVRFEDRAGHVFAADDFGMAWTGRQVKVWKQMGADEVFYGLGEKASRLNRRNNTFVNWNKDYFVYRRRDDPLYKTIPFYLGLPRGADGTRRAYGIFLDNSFRSRFDFGGQARGHVSFGAEGGELRYYVFMGPTPADVLRHYTELTGRMPLPPRWALGYHQSRYSYYPETEARTLVQQFRGRGIPLDVLHLDIHYMDGYRIFSWDPDRFPDPEQLAADLKQDGVKLVVIVDPGVKVDPGYPVHDEGLAADAFVKYPDGSLYTGIVWPGLCYFPDFTRPATRSWFGTYIRALMDQGIAGIWTDMNEPSVHSGKTMPAIVQHDLEGRGGSHREAHNVYGLLMARSVFEGIAQRDPEQRPFVITRAAFAGVQRYAAVWTGDNISNWSHLRLVTPMLLSLGLSGVPFAGSDIGGFAGTPTPELFARWMQLGAFSPFFRTHTALPTPRQEPWSYGPKVERVARRFIRLRYRLLPLFYTLFDEHRRTGLPILRPLAFHYPQDDQVLNIDDAFLVGDALLVAPVLHEGARHRSVYLPEGRWYDFWNGAVFEGGRRITAAAPLERMPLFVRAGTVLPLAPAMPHTDAHPVEALHLHLYPGTGTSWLYEDDGASRQYEDGAFRRTRFVLDEQPAHLTLRRRTEGDYASPIEHLKLYVSDVPAPRAIEVDGSPVELTTSAAAEPDRSPAHYHPDRRRLVLQVAGDVSSVRIRS